MAAEAFRERIASDTADETLAEDLLARRIDPYAAAASLVGRASSASSATHATHARETAR
jgi:hypothetical protein